MRHFQRNLPSIRRRRLLGWIALAAIVICLTGWQAWEQVKGKLLEGQNGGRTGRGRTVTSEAPG